MKESGFRVFVVSSLWHFARAFETIDSVSLSSEVRGFPKSERVQDVARSGKIGAEREPFVGLEDDGPSTRVQIFVSCNGGLSGANLSAG
jgi:hypothetical protein